jgi:acylphosphatase
MTQAVRVVIDGRVQGVGYRAWVEAEALARGLSGWVRNRRDGTVEAVFDGDPAKVEAMISACRSGPRMASVEKVDVTALEAEDVPEGFRTLPTR